MSQSPLAIRHTGIRGRVNVHSTSQEVAGGPGLHVGLILIEGLPHVSPLLRDMG